MQCPHERTCSHKPETSGAHETQDHETQDRRGSNRSFTAPHAPIDQYTTTDVSDINDAENLRVEGATLKGALRCPDGEWHDSELNLDEYIGIKDGKYPPQPLL